MAHGGSTKYDCFAPHFTQAELCEILGETKDTVDNWVRFGHLKPDTYELGPRGTPVKRYSIVGITRAVLIANCISHAGLKPSLAAQIAEFCAPVINEHFERDLFGEQVSNVVRLVVSQLQRDGSLASRACYRRVHEHHFYLDDPELNPKAQPITFPIDAPCIVVPLTHMFNHVFLAAAELLARQDRGAVDAPGLTWADAARTKLVGLTQDETKEFRLLLRKDLQQIQHNARYWALYEKYSRAAVVAKITETADA